MLRARKPLIEARSEVITHIQQTISHLPQFGGMAGIRAKKKERQKIAPTRTRFDNLGRQQTIRFYGAKYEGRRKNV